MKLWFVRVVVLVLLAGPASAVTLDYTSLGVLGDSLSDDGNLYRMTLGRAPPSPPYFRGRFSNGRVWAEHVADAFEDQGLPTRNFAVGGARARPNRPPNLATQARQYRLAGADWRGDEPLVAIWIGANDILQSAGEPNVRAVGRRAARTVGSTAASLHERGVDDFMIFDMPDLGKVPDFADDAEAAVSATSGARAYNRTLRRQIGALRRDGADVRRVSSYALLNALIDDPRRFGLRNTTDPCLQDGEVCSRRQGRLRAFFDEIHPNYVVHEHLADAALAAIEPRPAVAAMAVAPVPLPAPAGLLAGGLLWLALLARRRRRAQAA